MSSRFWHGRVLCGVVVVVWFWWSLIGVNGLVHLESTNEEFDSYPDPHVGIPFDDNLLYTARLQHLKHHLDLCPSTSPKTTTMNYNITVPPDGIPVALLAPGSFCSVADKARVASMKIYPQNVVRYIIVYNIDGQEEEVSQKDQEIPTTPLFWKAPVTPIYRHHRRLGDETLQHRPRRRRRRHLVPPNENVTVGVLHVSLGAGAALMHSLNVQHEATLLMGGPRVVLDGKTREQARHPVWASILLVGIWGGVVMGLCYMAWRILSRHSSHHHHDGDWDTASLWSGFTSARSRNHPPRDQDGDDNEDSSPLRARLIAATSHAVVSSGEEEGRP
mmetsp:Transcript_31879/g.73242  ORF Transcript_31879/g.73242 Transcript_31879/m.73242 type:complete len:332 (+) Transcript_31879:134-1129(+)